jgi:hypothetical protein
MDTLNGKDRGLSITGQVMAVGVVISWMVLLGWLTFHTEKPDIEWSRLLTVLSSLEAVAFAAAGALLGTTVQKRRVQEAQDRAQKAEGRATDAEKRGAANEQLAANGRALAVAVKVRTKRGGTSQPGGSGVERLSAGKFQETTGDELWELANQLFPG